MVRKERLYEGKAKIVYETDRPDLLLVEFKDSATAFNGAKKGTIRGKGAINARMSALLFELLESRCIPTHFVSLSGEQEMLVKRLEIIPLEVVVRNVAAGSLSKRLGLEEGAPLPRPVLELYYKSDALGDPLINRYHALVLGLATGEELDQLEEMALRVNQVLEEYLEGKGLRLVDFKLEFGRHEGQVVLGDEISPDTCRLWDLETGEKLDKDRFRRDLGGVEEAYQEVLRRLVT